MVRESNLNYMTIMKRRHVILLPFLATLAASAEAETPPWKVRLLKGQFDGSHWHAGVAVTLDAGWKTYWRVPGSGGIAPSLEAKGTNLRSFTIEHPVPQRLKAGDDDVIGYKDEVVFLLKLEPVDITKELSLEVAAFLGVCDEVCIPAQFNETVVFKPSGSPSADAAVLARWQSAVPKILAAGPVGKAEAVLEQGKIALKLALTSLVTDVFVEGNLLHYFHAPRFDGATTFITVSGANSLDDLKAKPLRLTLVTANGGLEQSVTVV
jgi:DsbC/DsbD-like thiol-disulfide interchange protein